MALMGMLFALAVAFSYLESLVPSFIAVPGIKLGLSNIITMYCLFFIGAVPALVLAALKSGFVFITRGTTAALLSMAGGMCSVAVMSLFMRIKASKGAASVVGAVTHNVAQLLMSSVLLGSWLTLYYLPVLIISGIIMGAVTALILKLILPAFSRLNL